MEIVYIVVGLIVLAVIYFLFSKKEETPALPDKETPDSKRLQERPSRTSTPPKKPERRSAPPPKPVRDRTPQPGSVVAREEEPAPPRDSQTTRVFSTTPSVEHMREGLTKARAESGFFGRLKALFAGKTEIGPEIAAEIEEILVASDVGVQTTNTILERVKESLDKGEHTDEAKVWSALRAEAERILAVDGKAGAFTLKTRPTVVLMVGVNGAGKTTTIGKLATRFKEAGLTCVLAAGDTFRAAAVQQLMVWGKRVGCEVVRGKDGADPGSVVFDAIKKAEETGADVVLADTAGRLHTKTNLMAEMQKIARTASKAMPGAPHEILLVVDATNGQNALAQAQEFKEALELTGVVLTKLDGTAKGGVILGISDSLALPVRFVGLGERPDDLHEFSAKEFTLALLGRDSEGNVS